MEFLTPYNIPDTVAHSDKTGLACKDKTKAQQQFRDECDINVLFARYLDTGEIPQIQGLAYGDFTGIYDFQTAQNAVRTALLSFETLPAKLKNRFDNDPQKLIEFLSREENRAEAEFLGLVNVKKEPTDDPGNKGSAQDIQEKPAGTTGTPPTQNTARAVEKP